MSYKLMIKMKISLREKMDLISYCFYIDFKHMLWRIPFEFKYHCITVPYNYLLLLKSNL